MKQIIRSISWILLSAIFLGGLASCESSQTKLAKTIEKIASGCPVEMPPFGTLTTVKYDKADNVVTYNIAVNEQYLPMDLLASNLDTTLIVGALRNANATEEASSRLLSLIDKAGASIKITYEGSSTGKNVEIELSDSILNSDVISKSETKVADWGEILVNSIARQRKTLPMAMSPEMIMEDVVAENNVIIYTVRLTPEGYEQFRAARRTPGEVKTAMQKMLRSTKTYAQFAAMLRSAGFSLNYILVNPEGETLMRINIPTQHL